MERPISAAIRELNEELMINIETNVSINDFQYIFSYRVVKKFSINHIDRHFYDFFILRKNDIIEENIKLQKSEVQAMKFVSLDILKKMLKTDKIVQREPIYDALLEYLYQCQ